MISIIIASAIMVYFVLLVILVLNLEDKSKIIKGSFLVFIVTLLVAFFLKNELVMDYLISIIIKIWYFPSFSTIILILFITMILFLYNLFNDQIKDKKRIVNYIFASYIIIGYIIFMLLDVNVNEYNSLYEGESLICVRYIARTFILWLLVILSMNYFNYIAKKEQV